MLLINLLAINIILCTAASPSTGNCPGSVDSGILWPSTPPCDYSIQRCIRKSDNATGTDHAISFSLFSINVHIIR